MLMEQWPLHGPADLAARVAAGNDRIQQDGFTAVLLDADRRVIATATDPSAAAIDPFGGGRGRGGGASTISAVARTPSLAPAEVIDRLSTLAPGVPHGHLLWARDGMWGRIGNGWESAGRLPDIDRDLPALQAASQWFDTCVAAGSTTGRVGDILDSRGLRDALICYTFRSNRHDEIIDALRRHERTPEASPSIPVARTVIEWGTGRVGAEGDWRRDIQRAARQEGPWQRMAQLVTRLQSNGDPNTPAMWAARMRDIDIIECGQFAGAGESPRTARARLAFLATVVQAQEELAGLATPAHLAGLAAAKPGAAHEKAARVGR
jgi:hypothetical protein